MGETGTRARQAARSAYSASQSVARAGVTVTRKVSRVVHRLTGASGAGRTGLANLIELTAAGSIGDGFVAVALAGTLFFSASVDQARGRIALALLITMAPFAILAPLIGPMLDKVQQGRKYILSGTLLARGLLCWGMAGAVQHNDALTLLPAAFGILVLQKVYGVTKSAVQPRLLPAEITLVTANARSGLASLIATTIGAGLAGGIDAITGGGTGGAAWVLRFGVIVYLAAMLLGFRLPEGVDAPEQAAAAAADQATTADRGRMAAGGTTAGTARRTRGYRGAGPHGTRPLRPADAATATAGTARTARPETGAGLAAGTERGDGRAAHGTGPGGGTSRGGTSRGGAPPGDRVRWRTLTRVGPIVAEAIGANATARAFSGFMIFFLAFLLRTVHFSGVSDKLALAEMIVAAGAGGFLGTIIGALIRARVPQFIMFGMLTLATVVTAFCAMFYGLYAALIVALVAALSQALAKMSLDAIVQREIVEEIRSSTFAASETIHQLSWVAGGLVGLLLSLTNSGVAGLTVAAAGLALSLVTLLLRRRQRLLQGRRALTAQAY